MGLHFCGGGEEGDKLFLQVTPQKKIARITVWRIWGPGVPPEALDGQHPLLENGVEPLHHHPGLVGLGPILLPGGSPEPSLTKLLPHLREDLRLQQVPVGELGHPVLSHEVRAKLFTGAMEEAEHHHLLLGLTGLCCPLVRNSITSW